MSYYASMRAADVLGVPSRLELGTKDGAKIGAAFRPISGEASHERSSNREASFEQRVFAHVGSLHKRNVARTLQDAVQISQVIDVTMDLLVGRMRFMRIPASQYSPGGTKSNVEAFWGFAVEDLAHPACQTNLILVGSLDGLVGTNFTAATAAIDDFNFPSDPDCMIEILNHELDLGVDLEDYQYETDWTPADSTNGQAAASALAMTERAGGVGYGKATTWARQLLPAQRVVAIISDIHVASESYRTILARPVCIAATV